MKLSEFLYYMEYGIKAILFKKHIPIVAGVPLTDVCNLKCVHCVVANTGRGHYSYEKLREIFAEFYFRGARVLYLQGGEIMTWEDAGKRINDVIALARDIGFFKVACVTNGTFPIDINSDAVWVSLDGTEEYHDKIRGKGMFALAMNNIRESKHKNIRANITVNNVNEPSAANLVKFVSQEPAIKGISVNFHTPYPGVEHLALSFEKRQKVLEQVMELKKQGYKVLNSLHALKALHSNRYRRPVRIIQMMEMDRIFECCWANGSTEVCSRCGYGIIPELATIEDMKIPSILSALGMF